MAPPEFAESTAAPPAGMNLMLPSMASHPDGAALTTIDASTPASNAAAAAPIRRAHRLRGIRLFAKRVRAAYLRDRVVRDGEPGIRPRARHENTYIRRLYPVIGGRRRRCLPASPH